MVILDVCSDALLLAGTTIGFSDKTLGNRVGLRVQGTFSICGPISLHFSINAAAI